MPTCIHDSRPQLLDPCHFYLGRDDRSGFVSLGRLRGFLIRPLPVLQGLLLWLLGLPTNWFDGRLLPLRFLRWHGADAGKSLEALIEDRLSYRQVYATEAVPRLTVWGELPRIESRCDQPSILVTRKLPLRATQRPKTYQSPRFPWLITRLRATILAPRGRGWPRL